ncbi:cytochrome b/b6 domain-containing protein [Methylophilus glucosoxydans]|uniref:Cytochrome b/b6 domain-containing protein n=1 Tax=Methylophilus glucosoxydans TaxID=752553 RepID=A0ABW3GDT1_9PROT
MLWPWWVRLSHWLVAAGVMALWLMSHVWYETDVLHRTVGYAVQAIILIRILVGCFSAYPSARFHLPGLRDIRLHIAEVRQATLPVHAGHNPLGQWAVYVIWMLIALLALTGWLSRTDAFWGEEGPVVIHALLSWLLMAVIALHIVAVIWIGRLSKQHLVRQMWHGRIHLRK